MLISSRLIVSTVAIALCAALAPAREAAAQVSQGCFFQGQQVDMSRCNPGSGGANGGGSSMNSAAIGAAGSVGYALGGVLGSMLRDALTDNGGTDEDAAAAAADQAQAMQRARANQLQQQQQRQADQAAQQHRFQVNQQDLLNQVHSLETDQSGGTVAPVDIGVASVTNAPLQPRQLDMSDPAVVDLHDAKTTTLDPRAVKGTSAAPHPVPASSSAALQRATIDDLRYLFPDEPSLWPGPKNPGARLINPLREPGQYQALLIAEEKQFPDRAEQIEKLRASLDTDAARRQRLAAIGDDIAKRYNATVATADHQASTKLDKLLDADQAKTGVDDRAALFAKSRQDPALAQSLRDQTRPILDARAKTVTGAQNRAMADMFDAFDRINPDAALRH